MISGGIEVNQSAKIRLISGKQNLETIRNSPGKGFRIMQVNYRKL